MPSVSKIFWTDFDIFCGNLKDICFDICSISYSLMYYFMFSAVRSSIDFKHSLF